jgi:glycosyltransferase involved in cell wall biosynthesis
MITMVSEPTISVLVPAYNVAQFIEESLASVQAQTLHDLQVIVVDDGSTDATLSIVERLAQSDPRIRVVKSTSRGGVVSALNLGLASCDAPYIARMDADDIAVPERLEKQLHYLRSHLDVALVGSGTVTINENGEEVGVSCSPITEKAVMKSLLFGPPCLHPTWLVRRELYEKLGGYRELVSAEDYDLLLRAVTSGFKIANLPDRLMRIRIRAGNTAHIAGLRQRKTHLYVVRLYKERLRAGADNFSRAECENAVRAGSIASICHGGAALLVQAAFRKSGKFRRVCLCALAAIISPWQARYFWDRLRWRLALFSS